MHFFAYGNFSERQRHGQTDGADYIGPAEGKAGPKKSLRTKVDTVFQNIGTYKDQKTEK